MIVVLQPGCTQAQVREVVARIEAAGGRCRMLRASGKPLVHILESGHLHPRRLRRMAVVQEVVAVPPPSAGSGQRPYFPYHFLGHLVVGLLLLGGLVFLAGFLPPGLGDPPGREVVWTPPWYLRAFEGTRELLGRGLGTLLLGMLVLAVLFLPELDRSRTGSRVRLPVLLAGLLVLAAGAWLTLRG